MPSPRPSLSSSDSSTPKVLSAQDSIENNSDPKSDNLDPNTFSEGTEDEYTLKPMDFEDFKKSVHLEYVNGANSFPEVNEDTLKLNQPIDPSRINDSLKLYNSQDMMSKSFNCEAALRTIDASFINDTMSFKEPGNNSPKKFPIQKSGSASVKNSPFHERSSTFEKGINRSKSGPNCFGYNDTDDDSTVKPATMRRNEARYVNLRPDYYNHNSDAETSRATETNSLSGAGELTSEGTEVQHYVTEDGVVLRRRPKTGSTAIKRRSGNKR